MTSTKRKRAGATTTKTPSRAPANQAGTTSRESRKPRKRTGPRDGKDNAGAAGDKAAPRKRQTKQAAILGLLQRRRGASIDELTKATQWQAHSVRAALTGLRKKGHAIDRTKDDAGVTRYRIDGGR